MENIHLTRKELYDLVWTQPMTSLAKTYRISDVGLRKLCIRMKVPVPSAGHWQKIAAGKKVKLWPLANDFKGDDKIILELRTEDDITQKNEAKGRLQKIENDPDIDFTVPKKLVNPDRLTMQAEKILREKAKASKHYDGFVYCWEALTIKVSKSTIDRALCFMDVLIKALKKRGHEIIVDNETYVVIAGEKLKVSLREKQKQVEVNKPFQKYDFVFTGKLVFKLDEIGHFKEWEDGTINIEERLPEIVATLEEAGEFDRDRRIRWQKEREEEEKKERIRKAQIEKEKDELNLFKELLSQAHRWQLTEMLHNYLEAFEKSVGPEVGDKDEFMKWIAWAKAKEKWFDPFVNANDELLKRVDKGTLTFKEPINNNYNFFSEEDSEETTEKQVYEPWKS
jgi:hypothetical protein